MLAALLAVTAQTVGGLPATAAGDAALSVSIEPVDTADAAKTTAIAGDTVGYVVKYSCLSADCAAVTLTLPATQTDSNGFGKRLLDYQSWTAPFAGATIAAGAGSSLTVSLGTVTAGTSANFTVYYGIAALAGGYTTDTAGEFFADGFAIQNAVTMTSTTAAAPANSAAAAVTWHNTVPDPSMSQAQSASSVRPAQQVNYAIYMSSGTWVSGGSGRIVGSAAYVGAGSYVVVDHLPAEATFVDANGQGVYDATAHTVTWTLGTPDQPNVAAAGGWGNSSGSGWVTRGTYAPRTVSVTYPASAFPDADASGCNFSASVTNSVTATLTYLDTAKTQKTTSSSATTAVSCYSPFGRSTASKDSTADASSGQTRLENVPPTVTGLTCPASGYDSWGRTCTQGAALAPFADNVKYWQVGVRNAGNVSGVAVVQDDSLDQADAPVYQIATSATATIDYSYRCGTGAATSVTVTGSSAALTTPQRQMGCRIVSATVTSGPVAAGTIRPTDTGAGTAFTVVYYYAVTTTAPVGETRTNTATGTMTYPGYELADIVNQSSRTIQFRAQPLVAPPTGPKPAFTAAFSTVAVVDGGGNAVPGRDVTFSVRGATANIPDGGTISPEYIFIAPTGWTINPDSAAFAVGTVPDGVSFQYKTVTVGSAARQAVIATWPADTSFGVNTTWPTLTVVAQPTFAVAPNTTSAAAAWIGDAQNQFTNSTATFGGATQDTGDIDDSGSSSDWFATATQNVVVFSSSGLSVVKEICQTDTGSGDCTWISDPTTVVPVAPDATNIRYRVTLRNTGNTTITGTAAYDVLPFVGDSGLTASTRSTPRGSTFAETLSATSDATSGLTLAYSASTNPVRPEVDPTAPGTVSDWGPGASGKKALRATVASLAPGETASFGYTTTVSPGSEVDSKACNSIAVASAQTLASEPLPVCASTAEADLAVTLSGTTLQSGRAGILPFVVSNDGRSAAAPAVATVTIPSGLTVTSFSPEGWNCTSPDDDAAPAAGPLTLACSPIQTDGTSRAIQDGTPEQLNVAVTTTKESGTITIEAEVTGNYTDPDSNNNNTQATITLAADATSIPVSKSDGVSAVTAGDSTTYTIAVQNPLLTEALSGVVITDTLPADATFVSASDGGTETGGVVTWNVAPLDPAAEATVSVTVRISPAATANVVNTVTAAASDPDNSGETLSGEDSDSDGVRALSIAKESDVPAIGVSIGDTISYTVTEKSVGSADFTASAPAAIIDDLSAVLTQAAFVAGSAMVSIDGGAAEEVADPEGGLLSWSGALATGQTVVLTYKVKVTAGVAVVANAAYTTIPTICDAGIDANGLPCAMVTDVFAPHLTIVKTATLGDENDNGTADAGESISYSFVVANDGGTDATTVTVDDPKVTGIAPATADIPAGETATFAATDYVVTQADVDAGIAIVNTATASGRNTTGDVLPASQPSSAETPVTAANPTLTLTKTAVLQDGNSNGTADADETIDYIFTVVNTGNVTLSDVAIADPKVASVTPTEATLATDATQVFTASYVVTALDVAAGEPITNTATASGTDPSGTDASSAPSTADTPVTLTSGLSIVKTQYLNDENPNGTADAGETITYSFTVTNTGNTPLSSVMVDDLKVTGISPSSVSLAAKASQVFTADVYQVTQAYVDAGDAIVNTATATGRTEDDAPIVSEPAAVTTPITPAAAALSIVKSADLDDANSDDKIDAGEVIRYHFVVTNSGNVTMTDVAVEDARVTGITPASVTLAPGEQQVFEADPWTASQDDIDRGGVVTNTAIASGAVPGGQPLDSPPSTVETPLADQAPALTIVKTAILDDTNGDGLAGVGESIAYTFLVTNTGNVSLRQTVVDDPEVSGLAPASVALLPGEQQVFTADAYSVVASDLTAGEVVNTATAMAEAPSDDLIASEPSTVRTKTAPVPIQPIQSVVGDVLAFTGSNLWGPLLLGSMLLLAGIAVFTLRRRDLRRTS